MSWTTPRTFVAGEVETAALFNTHLRDNLNALLPIAASVATGQTTASTSYADLATTGPAVTVTTNTSVLVVFGCKMGGAVAGTQYNMGYAVSGATTTAAADANSLQVLVATVGTSTQLSWMDIATVTAGSNTFTAKYKVSGDTGTFTNRRIAVFALN
jgi:hypothetical protein